MYVMVRMSNNIVNLTQDGEDETFAVTLGGGKFLLAFISNAGVRLGFH